jgi:hypothetical protein
MLRVSIGIPFYFFNVECAIQVFQKVNIHVIIKVRQRYGTFNLCRIKCEYENRKNKSGDHQE